MQSVMGAGTDLPAGDGDGKLVDQQLIAPDFDDDEEDEPMPEKETEEQKLGDLLKKLNVSAEIFG